MSVTLSVCLFFCLDLTIFFLCCQGIYYYFYQVFKNKAVAIAAAHRDKGRGDGTVGMFSWLVVAAIAGYRILSYGIETEVVPYFTFSSE